MTITTWLTILIALAYVAGSIPFGLWVGLAKGVDVRRAGSGNIGASNVGRLLGKKYSYLVFTLDAMKGLLPALAASALIHNHPADRKVYVLWILVGFAAIFGHMFSLFLGFKGGKGVSTSAGALTGICPYFTAPALIGITTWAVVYKLTGYISVGSISGALSFTTAYVLLGVALGWPMTGAQLPLLGAAIALPLIILYTHRGNIARLMAGTEHRAGQTPPQDRAV